MRLFTLSRTETLVPRLHQPHFKCPAPHRTSHQRSVQHRYAATASSQQVLWAALVWSLFSQRLRTSRGRGSCGGGERCWRQRERISREKAAENLRKQSGVPRTRWNKTVQLLLVQVRVSALSHPNCVALGKLLNLSVLSLLTWKMGTIKDSTSHFLKIKIK